MFAHAHALPPRVVQDAGPLLHVLLGAGGHGRVLVAVGVRSGSDDGAAADAASSADAADQAVLRT